MASRGLLVVLEGSDGAGKTTQFNLLSARLKAVGYDVETYDFPQYNKESSYFVRQYLSGAFGAADKISPYTASLFYALDRYEAAKSIQHALKSGKIVLVDRYVGSNMAYQGAKFSDPVEQRGFFVWDDNLEFQLLGIPRPDVNFFLRVPAEISAKLIDQRTANTATSRDEHEKNQKLLKKSLSTYDLLCQLFPKDFTAIECTKNGKLLSIPQISDLIWKKLKPLLPPETPNSGRPAIVTLGDKKIPTNTPTADSSDTGKLVHEFKDASWLLKLSIERDIRRVEPRGFSVWSDNGYRFFTPMGLSRETEKIYKSTMARLGELHSQMRQALQAYYEKSLLSAAGRPVLNISRAVLPVTPLAALCDFTAVFSASSVERVAGRLLSGDTPELQWAAQQIYLAARKNWPSDFKQPLESAGGPAPISQILSQMAEDKLSLNSGDREIVKLLEASPRQEFNLLAENIYPYSSLSLAEISEEVANWSYQQKYDSLRSAVGNHKVLAKIRYKFDVISDHLSLSEAINAAALSSIQVQVPSPRLGYEVPAVVEEANIEEQYLECFDESLKLFSVLQRDDRDDLTVYATILGHKLRWQFEASALNIKNMLEYRGSEAYQQMADAIGEAVAEIHPLTWDVLTGNKRSSGSPKQRQNRVKPAKRRRAKPKQS